MRGALPSKTLCAMCSCAGVHTGSASLSKAFYRDAPISQPSPAQARKRAELDAQLLANRIALLKQEEEKAWKKIEETRAREAPRDEATARNDRSSSSTMRIAEMHPRVVRIVHARNEVAWVNPSVLALERKGRRTRRCKHLQSEKDHLHRVCVGIRRCPASSPIL